MVFQHITSLKSFNDKPGVYLFLDLHCKLYQDCMCISWLFPSLLYVRLNSGAPECSRSGGGSPMKSHARQRRDKFVGGSGDILPLKIFKSTLSEMPFPAFWVESLHNSEYYKTQYKIHKRSRILFKAQQKKRKITPTS